MALVRQFPRWASATFVSVLIFTVACSSSDSPGAGAGGSSTGGSSTGGTGSGAAGSSSTGAPGAGSNQGGTGQAGASGSTSSVAGGGAAGAGGAAAGGAAGGGAAGAGGAVAGAGGVGGGAGASGAGGGGSGGASAFMLSSPAWTTAAGCAPDNKSPCGVFPKENISTSIGGSNKSPELDWTAGPAGTQSYAIVFHDLTNVMNNKPFVHWVMWNIPSATRMLPMGLETTAMPSVPAGSSQRSFSGNGYQGSGKCGNVYEFVLYALTTATFAPNGSSQTAAADGLEATGAPKATLRARSGAPGCTE